MDQPAYLMYGLSGCIVHYGEKARLEMEKAKADAQAKSRGMRYR